MNTDDMINTVMSHGILSDEQLDKLKDLIKHIDTTVYDEGELQPKQLTAAQLRKKYPALKDAYDQYRLVLKLVQGQETE